MKTIWPRIRNSRRVMLILFFGSFALLPLATIMLACARSNATTPFLGLSVLILGMLGWFMRLMHRQRYNLV